MKASVLDVTSAISFFLIGVFALGFVITYPLFRKQELVKSFFGNFVVGIISFYTLILLQVKFSLFTYIFPTLIFIAFILLIFYFKKRKINIRSIAYWNILFSILFVGISFWLSRHIIERIFFEPIFQWDAKVNWFLYAKKLFFADGLNKNTYYVYPTAQGLPHPGYPKIIPTIGAYITSHIGIWNDHLPKSSLLVFLIGVIIALLSARHIHFIWKIVIFVLLIGFSPYIQSTTGGNTFFVTIGYMDEWLAIYSALSLMFFVMYIRFLNKEYLFNAIACAFLLPNIKNEGMPIMLLIFIGYTISTLFLIYGNRRYLKLSLYRIAGFLPIICLIILPILIWKGYLKYWNIDSTDYTINFSSLFDPSTYSSTFSSTKFQLIQRDYLAKIFLSTYWYTYFMILLFCVVYLIIIKATFKNWRIFLSMYFLPIFCGLAFMLMMVIIFCLVPINDLQPYLAQGADRAGLHSYYLVFASFFSLGMTFFYLPYKNKLPNNPTNRLVSINKANKVKVVNKSKRGK